MSERLDIERGQFFECRCGCGEHVLRFVYVSMPDPDPEVYTEIYLYYPDGILKRAWRAIKYFLGYKCAYGDFDCFILRDDDVERLIGLLQNYREDMARQKEASKVDKGKENENQQVRSADAPKVATSSQDPTSFQASGPAQKS
jgi:hypothetical protein